ncbi:hypothetical protein [Shewanella sediminis]|nr:hypothetical protein [Shewanella sediminis]
MSRAISVNGAPMQDSQNQTGTPYHSALASKNSGPAHHKQK